MEHEFECDELLLNLVTPPPEPARPRTEQTTALSRRRGAEEAAPKFALLPGDFYGHWVEHTKRVKNMKPKVNAEPPPLQPEMFLKPRKVTKYAFQLQDMMTANKAMIEKICLIQKDRGKVKCWQDMSHRDVANRMLYTRRVEQAAGLKKKNVHLQKKIVEAKSDMPSTKDLDEEWKRTKECLIQGANQPFILFDKETIDRGIKDPAFIKPEGFNRQKVSMDLFVDGGSKVGRIFIELFNDVVPKTCNLFLKLIRGDQAGYAYTGTRIYRIVPGLYCRGGDVDKNNGFGCFRAQDGSRFKAENFILKHSVPGVLSFAANKEGELNGHFNIIFKPLPQLDGKNVVFGRIISGPAETLTRISAQGLPLGTTQADVVIKECGRYTESGSYKKGAVNTRRFPKRRKVKQ